MHIILTKLPMPQADTIQETLAEKLVTGATLSYEDKTWNVKVMSEGDGVFIRAHSVDNSIQGAFFYPSEMNPQILLQKRFSVVPPENTFSEESIEGEDKNSYPLDKVPYVMKIMMNGTLLEDESSPKIAKDAHDFAKKWFTENGAKASLLPVVAPITIENPNADSRYEEHQEAFKYFFQGLALLTITYYVSRFGSGILNLFKKAEAPKSPISSPVQLQQIPSPSLDISQNI